jgi:hypothetical protein
MKIYIINEETLFYKIYWYYDVENIINIFNIFKKWDITVF